MLFLREGRFDFNDLIQWFGIDKKTWWTKSAYYREILETYCDFDMDFDKKVINIKKVYRKIYTPALNKGRIRKLVMRFVWDMWNENGIDTYENIVRKLHRDFVAMNVNDETAARYVKESFEEVYGKPNETPGTDGVSYRVLCKVVSEGMIEEYEPLSSEEKRVLELLVRKYVGKDILDYVVIRELMEDTGRDEWWEMAVGRGKWNKL